MKCYLISKDSKENSIFLSEDALYIYEAECPEVLCAEGIEMTEKYEIRKTDFFECVATSDSGIDSRESDTSTYELPFENLVLCDECFIGVYLDIPKRILYFDDKERDSITVITEEKFVGGWGDVTKGYSYWLSEKK